MIAAVSKTESAETITHVPEVQVDPTHVKINDAGQCWRTVLVRMPEGSTADDLRNPKIWKRVQTTRPAALIKMDQLLILGHDESWYTRAIVTHAENTSATLAIEKVSKFRGADERLYSDGTLEVYFDGGAYGVRRVSDQVRVISEGFTTENLAIAALRGWYPKVI